MVKNYFLSLLCSVATLFMFSNVAKGSSKRCLSFKEELSQTIKKAQKIPLSERHLFLKKGFLNLCQSIPQIYRSLIQISISKNQQRQKNLVVHIHRQFPLFWKKACPDITRADMASREFGGLNFKNLYKKCRKLGKELFKKEELSFWNQMGFIPSVVLYQFLRSHVEKTLAKQFVRSLLQRESFQGISLLSSRYGESVNYIVPILFIFKNKIQFKEYSISFKNTQKYGNQIQWRGLEKVLKNNLANMLRISLYNKQIIVNKKLFILADPQISNKFLFRIVSRACSVGYQLFSLVVGPTKVPFIGNLRALSFRLLSKKRVFTDRQRHRMILNVDPHKNFRWLVRKINSTKLKMKKSLPYYINLQTTHPNGPTSSTVSRTKSTARQKKKQSP